MNPRAALGRIGRVAGVGAVIVVALVVILTALRTELPRGVGVMSDALGPASGEPVAGYLAHAEGTLVGDDDEVGDGADDADGSDDVGGSATGPDPEPVPRWALVSAEQPWTVAEAADAVAGVPRVSAMYVQTPIPGVAMPVGSRTLVEPVAGEATREPTLSRGLDRAADAAARRSGDAGGRAGAVEALTAQGIRADRPAIIALVVRGTTPALRGVADGPGVRAVEALPADAVWGHFAVRPLLPQQRDVAEPLPDHAPLPDHVPEQVP